MEMTPKPSGSGTPRAATKPVTPGRRVAELFNHGYRVLLVLAIVFLLNFFLRDRFVRADLTQEKLHTISDATKKILSQLTDLVTIKAYVSEELPKSAAAIPIQLRDFLDEYETYGGGKVKVFFIDPKTKPEEAEIARQIGINPYPLQEIEADQAKVVNCYLSVAIFFGSQQEHLNLPETGINEYDFTRAIRKVSKAELAKIGIIAPDAPPQDRQQEQRAVGFQKFQTELETQYRVQRVYLKSGTPVPEDIATLIVVRPKDLSQREAFEIDQFVMRGGKAIFFLDGTEFLSTRNGIVGTPITSGLAEVLESYGVKLRPELVLDKRMGQVVVRMQQGPFVVNQPVNYPFSIVIAHDTMAASSPIVRSLDRVQMNWAQPLELLPDKLAGVQVTELLKSSGDSWLRSDTSSANVDMSGAAYLPPAEKDRKAELLAALLVGKFKSSFAGKPVPEPAPPPDAGEPGAGPGGPGPHGVPGGADFPPNLPPELRDKLQQRGLAPTHGGTPPPNPGPTPPKNAPPASDPPKAKSELPPPAPPAQEEGAPKPANPPAPAPAPAVQTPPPDEPIDEEPAEPPREVIAESPETRVLVVSDSDFISDDGLSDFNWAFLLNTVDWFSQDEDMISIRSRGITDRSIEATSTERRKFIKLAGTFAMPVLVGIFGFVYLSLRKRGRKTAVDSAAA